MHGSSISNSEYVEDLRSFSSEEAKARLRKRILIFLIALFPAACLASFSPYEFLTGRLFINASIRTAQDPAVPPYPGHCETTPDGLHYYPSRVHPVRSVLVVGDSTSFWNRYPLWLDRYSAEKGHRFGVFSAAQEGIGVFEMEDALSYILDHNCRHFDLVLVRPSPTLIWRIGWPPGRYDHPPTGSGYSLRYSGAPYGATETFFFDHFRATLRRRANDLFVRKRNRKFERWIEQSRPERNVQVVTRIPPEMEPEVRILRKQFATSLSHFDRICKEHSVPLVFMTTGSNRFLPSDPYVQKAKDRFPSFQKKFSLICIYDELTDALNETTRDYAEAHAIPLVDSAAYISTFSTPDLWIPHDCFHPQPWFEPQHAEFVYEQLRDTGF